MVQSFRLGETDRDQHSRHHGIEKSSRAIVQASRLADTTGDCIWTPSGGEIAVERSEACGQIIAVKNLSTNGRIAIEMLVLSKLCRIFDRMIFRQMPIM